MVVYFDFENVVFDLVVSHPDNEWDVVVKSEAHLLLGLWLFIVDGLCFDSVLPQLV